MLSDFYFRFMPLAQQKYLIIPNISHIDPTCIQRVYFFFVRGIKQWQSILPYSRSFSFHTSISSGKIERKTNEEEEEIGRRRSVARKAYR
jgi:hypothetical protein